MSEATKETPAPTKAPIAGAVQYRPKSAKVWAARATEGQSVKTKKGIEVASKGDYIVVVGTIEKTQHVPPTKKDDGTSVPGEVRVIEEPACELMRAEDFEELYDKA